MSAIKINSKLSEIDSNLDKIDSAVKEGKRKIAQALKFNDIVEVMPNDSSTNDFETFTRYAELIMSIKTRTSPMKLVYTIDPKRINKDALATDLKRTVILPMNYGQYGNSIDNIITSIVKNDKGTYTSSSKASAKQRRAPSAENNNLVIDSFGNEVFNGLIEPEYNDIEVILTKQEQENIERRIENLKNGNYIRKAPSNNADYSNATYNYIVDWGDGTVNQFSPGNSKEENNLAVYHTYKEVGTYMIKIYGNFREIRSFAYNNTIIMDGSDYLKDKDGLNVTYSNNSSHYYLSEIRSFGNTRLVNTNSAFLRCYGLKKLPSDFSSQPFKELKSANQMFEYCTSLQNIPYDHNLQTGLFSNCKNLFSVYHAFAVCHCSCELPLKFLDGSDKVDSIGGLFWLNNLTAPKDENGNPYIPSDLFKGLKNLTNAGNVFRECGLYNADITNCELFKDCVKLNSFSGGFRNCGITGTLNKNFFPVFYDENGNEDLNHKTSKFNLDEAFRATHLSGIDKECFRFFKNATDGVFMLHTFQYSNITEIPEGLLDPLENNPNLFLNSTFADCTKLKTIPSNCLKNIKSRQVYGLFANCTSLECELPEENPDWLDERYIRKWYGAFANCTKMKNFDQIPFELTGQNTRRFPNMKVGSIVLKDRTLVDPSDFVYDSSNKPIGVVYADEYITKLDRFKVSPNTTFDKTKGMHKIYATVFNTSDSLSIIREQKYANLTKLNGKVKMEMAGGYLNSKCRFTYNSDGSQSCDFRYNGEEYIKVFREVVFESGFYDDCREPFKFYTKKYGKFETYSVISSTSEINSSNASETNLYFLFNSDDLIYEAYVWNNSTLESKPEYDVDESTYSTYMSPILNYVNNYSVDGETKGQCFIPDTYEGPQLLYFIRDFLQPAFNKIVGNGSFNSSNCYNVKFPYHWCGTFMSTNYFGMYDEDDNYTSCADNTASYRVRPSFSVLD